MNLSWEDEKLEEQEITYLLDLNGQIIVIEHVPARVNKETGERLFSPETVERLQQTVWRQAQPKRMMQVPVYDYA